MLVVSSSLVACDSGSGDGEPMADGSTSESDGSASTADATGGTGGGSDTTAGGGSGGETTGASGDDSAGDSGAGDTGTNDGNANCCLDHSEAGCNEPLVQECVCQIDASCCVFDWDLNCAQMAEQQCQSTCVDGPKGEGPACEPTAFQHTPDQAEYTGDWSTTMSQVGEGIISVADGSAGAVTHRFDIPCADTWYVWVRYFDNGDNDAYFVRVDGEPSEAAVFEGDCTSAGEGYGWRLLNWRDPGDPSCTYLEDPWTFQWGPGEHTIEFSLLESTALGRIVLSNSADFDPADYQ
jgi:hypothetical protein